MAAPVRRADLTVAEILFQSPWDFDFFQALRLLAGVYPQRRLLAGFEQSPEEAARFHANLSLLFPASPIQAIQPPAHDGGPVHMTVNFMGLTGPQGPLPTHYTEYLIARRLAHDQTAAAFFDLFNHRLISLFYLAWEKHHFPVAYERESVSPSAPRRFTEYLFDLIGMGTPGLGGRIGMNDYVLLSYAGIIAQRPRSASSLAGMLRDFFQAPLEVDQFVGKWCRLEADSLSWLGGGGVHNQLGGGAIAGDQVWSRQARFRIRVGPLTWERFNDFLPDGAAFQQLVRLTRYFVNQTLDFEVQVIPMAREVPPSMLSSDAGTPRLGWSAWMQEVYEYPPWLERWEEDGGTSWLQPREVPENPRDLVLAVRASGPI